MQVEEITLWTQTVPQDVILSVHLSSKEARCTQRNGELRLTTLIVYVDNIFIMW